MESRLEVATIEVGSRSTGEAPRKLDLAVLVGGYDLGAASARGDVAVYVWPGGGGEVV